MSICVWRGYEGDMSAPGVVADASNNQGARIGVNVYGTGIGGVGISLGSTNQPDAGVKFLMVLGAENTNWSVG